MADVEGGSRRGSHVTHYIALGHVTCRQPSDRLNNCHVIAHDGDDGILSAPEALQDHGGGGQALLDVVDGGRLRIDGAVEGADEMRGGEVFGSTHVQNEGGQHAAAQAQVEDVHGCDGFDNASELAGRC